MTADTGRWETGTAHLVTAALADAGIPTEHIGEAIDNLLAAGLIVVADFYVPTEHELLGQYMTLAKAHLAHEISIRWVMCTETHNALYRRHLSHKFARHPDLRAAPCSETERSPLVFDFETWDVISRTTILGVPIRIDPAARRPTFEIDPTGQPS